MTIVEIRNDLSVYKASKAEYQRAFTAIAQGGQSVEIRDGDTTRVLTRANLPEIRNTLKWIDGKIAELEADLAKALGNPVRPKRLLFIRGVK